jgi:hypothetical protein
MILLVAGSRSIKDKFEVDDACDIAVNAFNVFPDVVISGRAMGVDTFGEAWARKRNFPFVPFKALWDDLGHRAGYLRNKQMALAATHAVIVWDGKSRGAEHMINLCRKYEIPVWLRTVYADGEIEEGMLE